MRHVLALSPMLGLASPVAALTIPTILCENANGTVADDIYIHDADDDWLPGMTTFIRHESADDADGPTQVIAHCATGKAVTYAGEMDDVAYRTLRAAIEGEGAVTLRQLARQMRGMGVDATYGTLSRSHCACNPETHRPSF